MTAVRDSDYLLSQSIEQNGEPKRSTRPSLAGWTREDDRIADVIDLLNVLITVTARSDRPHRPVPRPFTAMDRWEKSKRAESTRIVESAWFPEQ